MDPISKFSVWAGMHTGKGGAEKLGEKELRESIADPKIPDDMREGLIKELFKRLEGKISSGKGTEEDARQLILLPKLIDGTITASENEELGKLMGVELPKVKGGKNDHQV